MFAICAPESPSVTKTSGVTLATGSSSTIAVGTAGNDVTLRVKLSLTSSVVSSTIGTSIVCSLGRNGVHVTASGEGFAKSSPAVAPGAGPEEAETTPASTSVGPPPQDTLYVALPAPSDTVAGPVSAIAAIAGVGRASSPSATVSRATNVTVLVCIHRH